MERIQIISNHLVAGEIKQQKKAQPSATDFFDFDGLLTEKELAIRKKAEKFAKEEINSLNINEYYERAEFPLPIIERLKGLNWVGANIKGYGSPELTSMELGLIAMEISKSSADIATFYTILLNITMLAIYYSGSEQQKQYYLPKMTSLEKIGAFALTEPEAGSDAAGLKCTAKQLPNGAGWILNGEKRWIGNAPMADIIVIWARNIDTNKIHGFILEPSKVASGGDQLRIETLQKKFAFRSVQNGHIFMKDCFIAEDQRLTNALDFNSGPGKCLFLTRIVVGWIALGVASNAYEKCLQYVKQRNQFGQPLAQFQLVQERLVKMCSNIQAISLMCHRVSQLFDQGKLSSGQVGLLKAFSTSKAREVVSMARELFGGNGILLDDIGRNFLDMEGIYTFEGTYDVNTLIAAREITGLSAISSINHSKSQQQQK
ncbi:hypothetical protein DDB_G0274585 [Dictyostelium discoideum AX4]|uniref:Acyl-CoA dehydrogenase n=1 Tax=Dictyostelium discoideum TaxID=44689 RepID=Q86A74_DICDI|nr:hypothetical protein DDB_G0274585 [Dictyostelium discoideum AX4]EAL70185.1 hypothetical protein DDB_G0274585 [Dictyostelium discoideum AX4]|eukprot:XP_643912.1 hypothetical protein DDB_G0274585 [Dictyostelium discoideum AX4]